VVGDVGDVQPAVDERETTERERQRRAQPGPQRGERGDGSDAGDDRDQAGEHVLADAETRAAVHERVVERVNEAQDRRDAEDQRLA
jgi:hypothetical protein